jgi:hypothetical protein
MDDMDDYTIIKADLERTTPVSPTVIPPLYNDADSLLIKVETLKQLIQRAKIKNDRVGMVLNAFYLGELIGAQTRANRTLCMEAVTRYYYTAANRVYYIFELLGPTQIARTRSVTLAMITKLKEPQYQQLQVDAAAIAGARV